MKNAKTKPILKQILNILSVFGYVLLICAIITLCYFIISNKMKNRVPVFGGYSYLYVVSDSMEDTLSVGEGILVKKTAPADIKEGDIISYYFTLTEIQAQRLGINKKEVVITHRVAEITKDTNGKLFFVTKGDNNTEADDWFVPAENVIGVLDESYPVVLKILSFFNNPLGMIFLVIFPLSLILVSDITSLFKVMKDKENKLPEEEDDEFGDFNYGTETISDELDEYNYQSNNEKEDYYSDDD